MNSVSRLYYISDIWFCFLSHCTRAPKQISYCYLMVLISTRRRYMECSQFRQSHGGLGGKRAVRLFTVLPDDLNGFKRGALCCKSQKLLKLRLQLFLHWVNFRRVWGYLEFTDIFQSVIIQSSHVPWFALLVRGLPHILFLHFQNHNSGQKGQYFSFNHRNKCWHQQSLHLLFLLLGELILTSSGLRKCLLNNFPRIVEQTL